MKVESLGEFGLIDQLSQQLSRWSGRTAGTDPADLVLGIGDDAAVFRGGSDLYWLATCDAQIDGIHFISKRTDPTDLGRRVAAINLSDIAAMGGVPRFALSALRVPPGVEAEWVSRVYEGLQKELASADAVIIGGNTARSDSGFSIDLFLLGQVAPTELLTRDAVRPGDMICVTGSLGASRAGLYLLDHPETAVSTDSRSHCLRHHRLPQARLRAGRRLATSGLVRSCIDISDGLFQDAGHLATRSSVGIRLHGDRIPIAPYTQEVADVAGDSALRWALEGGEDFELLFSVPPGNLAEVLKLFPEEECLAVTVIGEAVEAPGGVQLVDGAIESGETRGGGFDHFGGSRP